MRVILAILLLIGVVLAAAAIIGAVQGIHVRRLRRQFLKAHRGWDAFLSPYDKSIVAVSPGAGEVALGYAGNPRFYPRERILSVEILRDDGAFTGSASALQLAGAAIGGMAFGWRGALAGAVIGTKSPSVAVKQIELHVTVEDPTHPLCRAIFFRSPWEGGSPETSALCLHTAALAEKFRVLLHVPITIRIGTEGGTVQITMRQ